MQEGLFTGHNYRAIELGHVIVEQPGILCRCNKRGCLETISSYYAIEAAVQKAYSEKCTPPILYDLTDGEVSNLDLDAIMQAYNRGEVLIQDIVAKAMRHFALMLKTRSHFSTPRG